GWLDELRDPRVQVERLKGALDHTFVVMGKEATSNRNRRRIDGPSGQMIGVGHWESSSHWPLRLDGVPAGTGTSSFPAGSPETREAESLMFRALRSSRLRSISRRSGEVRAPLAT